MEVLEERGGDRRIGGGKGLGESREERVSRIPGRGLAEFGDFAKLGLVDDFDSAAVDEDKFLVDKA